MKKTNVGELQKVLDDIRYQYGYHPVIIRCERSEEDIILEVIDIATNPVRLTFKNAEFNKNIEDRLAVNLLDYSEYIRNVKIEIADLEYSLKNDNNQYFLKLYLRFIPEEWFDYKVLKIKKGYREEKEDPIISLMANEIIVDELKDI